MARPRPADPPVTTATPRRRGTASGRVDEYPSGPMTRSFPERPAANRTRSCARLRTVAEESEGNVLAVDQGTSGTKALVVSRERGVIGSAEVAVRPTYGAGGLVE